MKKIHYAILGICCIISTSCYIPATVSKVPAFSAGAKVSGPQVHTFRVTGLPQLYVFLLPNPRVFTSDSNIFSQAELASFLVHIKALSGPIIVNEGVLHVQQGEEKRIDLHKRTERVNGENRIVEGSRYSETLSLFSDSNEIPMPNNDVIVTVVDPTGLTRSRGIKITGGFQDGF